MKDIASASSAIVPNVAGSAGELSVTDVLAQTAKIKEILQSVMRKDVHYGVVPGTGGKPTLYKPGSEKLCLVFRLDPEYEIVREEVTPTLVAYTIRCILTHITTGQRISSGMGSCSSRETKYGFRQGTRSCPKCKVEAIIDSKFDDGGYYCFPKRGGCGSKFPPDTKEIKDQKVGRVAVDNVHDQSNTILKMACKRALAAAVLAGTAASDVFEQDLEELDEALEDRGVPRVTRRGKRAQATAAAVRGAGTADGSAGVTNPSGSHKGAPAGGGTVPAAAAPIPTRQQMITDLREPNVQNEVKKARDALGFQRITADVMKDADLLTLCRAVWGQGYGEAVREPGAEG